MKKLTDFIVDKRNILLCILIVLSSICLYLSNKVNINRDISKYLPNDSETRIGNDIMDESFGSLETSTLNIMFKGLSSEEKEVIYEEMLQVDGVKEIEYDSSTEYNKDDYTLYVITVDASKDSSVASDVYDEIMDKYKEYEVYTSGDVSDENKDILPIWIVFLAIGCALIILIIMCDSYLEPFLFLVSIGMAVIINKGTNIIFPSISSITNAIAAILQLALSMDYSIMLMNRYRQEKEKEKDDVKAMKKALYHSFSSISSSSVTTIVGLLALVFMSFTIGRDLGLVLAKGVLFSLLTIFTCLPALILIFDKWIIKTKKKSPNIRLNTLGKIIYKCRYFGIILFIIIFISSFILKNNLSILYTDSKTDEVGQVFATNNQIAVIYKNEYEDKIDKYCHQLEDNNKIDEVLCYGNTINEALPYSKFNAKLADLNSDTTVEDYLLRIVYYNYYVAKENNKITFNDFVNFIKSDVYQNAKMSEKIDDKTRVNIDRLANFTDSNLINRKHNSSDIAKMFEIDQETVNDLLIYYHSLNTSNQMTITDFIQFMNDYVMNSKYAKDVDAQSLQKLNTVSKFMDANVLNREMSYQEMAKLFDMDEKVANNLYLYYISINDIDQKLTISEFANFVNDYVMNNPEYSSSVEGMQTEIQLLKNFSDLTIVNQEMTSEAMANLLGLDDEMVANIYLLKCGSQDNGTELTINQFVNYTLAIDSERYILTDEMRQSLMMIKNNQLLMTNPTLFTATDLANLLQVENDKIYLVYALIDFTITGNSSSWTLTPQEFVNFILDNIEREEIASGLTEENLSNLKTLQFIMQSSRDGVSYSYQELAQALSLPEQTVKAVYSLYVTEANVARMTPVNYVKFILDHQQDPMLASSLDQDTLGQLQLLQKIMDSVLNRTLYNAKDLSNLLGLDLDETKLLYSLYAINYKKEDVSLSYQQFITFLIDDVINNQKYSNNFDNDKKLKINTIDDIINGSLANNAYTKEELYKRIAILSDDVDKDLVDLLYIYYGSVNDYDEKWTLTVEQFVNFLNDDILKDSRFDDFIDEETEKDILDGKELVDDAKELLISNKYSRMVLNTKYAPENEETFAFIKKLNDDLNVKNDIYIIGNSPMAYEISQTFQGELTLITILTIVFIFVVVAFTFKSALIPIVLVFLIQTAVYLTMGILTFEGGTVYFISLLIVQSILMGATIDYAILYTSYYLETRKTADKKEAVITAYNKSIHTILTSASILTLVTLVVGHFGSAIASKICITISQGTLCSTILILFILPMIISSCDRILVKRNK